MILKTGANTMITTDQFLDMCAEKTGSDYQTSLALNKPPSYVSNMRRRGGVLPDDTGLKVAELLDFPDDSMILCLAAERALKSGSFEYVERLRKAAESRLPGDIPIQQELIPSTGTHK
ncbi:hypothetical protein HBA55_34765 [Pseudomaricurvus alkylphenolicus]|uniref:hypothetical protein n=1 Tax=Pseudomaricurvus alkylphenolicus TaxID=1306991 RepID=UPI00141FF190|nr:hypothetical protein [Pseudomaricurvus alkylphenolicus]NIB44795.1 hypothetical protein [Pseudomaricurvus alkylphenolicus]